MKMETNKSYAGFILLEERLVKEVNSTARIFCHEKSGAKLLHLENDDDNKVFSISFKTLPEDSTGAPHILEHSVLCGSRKFPVKKLFVELEKSSMSTYLNAMTFPDKTVYATASRNDKDFLNQINIYLDAVFYPNIYTQPEIMQQEGWHYELDRKDGELVYNGVVYNEMKGIFSSPESILLWNIQKKLFPDTIYKYESVGDFEIIPELTTDKFTGFHKKYYHPSNSYIYLYGNGDLQELLEFINDEYLQHFDRVETNIEIGTQEPFKLMKEHTIEYPIPINADPVGKAYLSLNYAVGKAEDVETCLAMKIIMHFLLATQAAPLKKALITAGIGRDVLMNYNGKLSQHAFSIIARGTDEHKKEAFKQVIVDTLKGMAENGADHKLILASINYMEFQLREASSGDMPKGLGYNLRCLDTWLYDSDPLSYLEYEAVIEKMKTAINDGYFEALISKYLLDNDHCSMILLKPKCGMQNEQNEKVKTKLALYKESLNEQELSTIIEKTFERKEIRNTIDSKENLKKIPVLNLCDIQTKIKASPHQILEEQGTKVLYYPAFTSDIVYYNLIFDTRVVPQELISYVALLSDLLGKVSTSSLSFEELAKEINYHTGGIRFGFKMFTDKDDEKHFHPKFYIETKVLSAKVEKSLRLIYAVITESLFEDEKRLKRMIYEIVSHKKMSMLNDGQATAIRCLLSKFTLSGMYEDATKGVSYYEFLKAIEKDFDHRKEMIVQSLQCVSALLFNANNMMANVTCEASDYEKFKVTYRDFVSGLDKADIKYHKYRRDFSLKKTALLTQGNVQHIAQGYNLRELGYQYCGSYQVLHTIVKYDYLWNRIRMIGGAYGAIFRIERNGNAYIASYRDPNLKETLDAYKGVEYYIRNFAADNNEMNKYIIRTMSWIDQPLTPEMKGEKALDHYISNTTLDDLQQERDEILCCKPSHIINTADFIADILKKNCICALVNEGKIRQNIEMFDEILDVLISD